MTFRADLHCHTTCSDGSLSPEEIVGLAAKNSLQGLAITDHDSINAYATAIPAAQKAGIELITGVEFSTVHNDITVHILGYAFAPDNPLIRQLCERHQQRRQKRNQEILAKLAAHGMPLTMEEVMTSTDTSVGRPHIAMAMLKKGYIQSVAEAFHLYIGEEKSCYVRGDPFLVQEAIDILHQARGFAIIAHPHLVKESHIMRELLDMNFDGIEGYYAKMNPEQNRRWVKVGKKKEWLITGGSDFHGASKPFISLGCSTVDEGVFRVLQSRFHENCKGA